MAFCAALSAQTNTNSGCPAVDVVGPSYIVEPGEPVAFTAILSENSLNYDINYEWSVSSGEILEGQGTTRIKVLYKDFGKNLTATVLLKGLPEICGIPADSDTVPTIDDNIHPLKTNEFSTSVKTISKFRLDSLAIALRNDPDSVAYIFEHFRRGTAADLIKQKLEKTIKYLAGKGIDRDRVIIKTVFSDKNLTQFWTVPAGAETPTIEDN